MVERAREAGLVSDEHFSVDGTLLEAWASLKSFQPKEQRRPHRPMNRVTRTIMAFLSACHNIHVLDTGLIFSAK
jgi:hypothetical protein